MPSDSYSFLDVVVVEEVRERFAVGDALVIISTDLEQVIWANGPGAAVFGHADIEAMIGARSKLPPIARRQIKATPGFPQIGHNRIILLRLAEGMTSRAVMFLASAIEMPDREPAILLAAPAGQTGAHGDATTAISGFTEDGHFIAMVDSEGEIEAASAGFEALGIERSALAALIDDVAHDSDRLVKRLIRAGPQMFPAGLARLTDQPARHLLVVIDDAQADGEPEQNVMAAMPAQANTPVSQAEGGPHAHDRWYFSETDQRAPSSDENARLEPTRPDAAAPNTEDAQLAQSTGEPHISPVRFVWRTDSEGRFSMISPEFAAIVGAAAADIVGRKFRDVATVLNLDPAGEISGLLERRDTWSGRSVLWPVTGTAMAMPVDLAALPVYDRNRIFEGFRGFGVARPNDARDDPERIGLALVPNAPSAEAPPTTASEAAKEEPATDAPDPFRGEVPALTIVPKPERRFTDKVIRLAEHRQPAKDRILSSLERSAFREIGERLKKDGRNDNDEAEVALNSPATLPSTDVTSSANDTTWPEETSPSPESGTAKGSLLDLASDDRSENETAPATATPTGDHDSMAAADLRDAADDEWTAPLEAGSPDNLVDPISPAPPEEDGQPQGQTAIPAHIAEGFLPSAFPAVDHGRQRPDTSILAKLPVPVLIHSGDVLHYANDEFLDLTGYETLDALEAAGGLETLFADPYGDDAATDEADHNLHLRTQQGTELPVDALLRSVPWQGGKALMLVVRRTGDERPDPHPAPSRADNMVQPDTADLKSHIAEMRTIIDTATDGVVLIDRGGVIRSISRPAEALFGFESDEVAGKPFTSLFAIESQRAARDYLAGLSEHGVASVLNDGREVIGREAQGRFIPLFMTIGRLPNESGFCAVVRDITQWKRAEEDLTQARALAERASSQKTDFLARISHEIRTPLNAIIGFSELMVDEKFGPIANDRYRDYLRDINRSGNHVLDLVNDLLDISKIEAGQQEMDYEAVSLNDTLAEAVATMQPQANRERVIIRSSFASRLPEIVADLRSVRQIALNILSNAVRYTQAGGQVIVSTAYEISGDVVMRVRDTGIGMTQSEIEQALKPFKQINALKRGRNDGTGLGLPLTKAMVEANRARFTINSTPGEGTLVEVAFPSTRVLAE
ncbi:PAS domain S-box protein [Manganibacter manganicus]|uniref:histidine kinase n=1 Tax=Manganibacter manganicus TaxID=1873176 RepID=A0A1V8RQ03_9HYPH|nr:PAS domain S-box protein [Pseudaminobacter manganicus]OQM75266.1 PAS domain-containing sensor histidine kinase [Pseudaminobacter manganicus]